MNDNQESQVQPFESQEGFVTFVKDGMNQGWYRLEKEAVKAREAGKEDAVSLQAKLAERLGVKIPAKQLQEQIKSIPELKGMKRKGAVRAKRTRQKVTFFSTGAVATPVAKTDPELANVKAEPTPIATSTPVAPKATGGNAFFGS